MRSGWTEATKERRANCDEAGQGGTACGAPLEGGRAKPAARLEIRPATRQDAGPLSQLRSSVLAEGAWFLADPDEVVLSVEAVGEELAALDRQPNSRVLLAWRGRTLVGACWLRGGRLRRVAHEASLELMVLAEERGRGVGRRLLSRAIGWAEGQPGLGRLVLAVMADNERAVALYRAQGFVEEGRRRGSVREADGRERDDLLMARTLRPAEDSLSRGG